ncbi:hypothetical protein FS749_011413 [Ceratobasidium sp. UAMH 11750]|nr:hypothetical protein FS749_011413 [Ceratobasidium sp. UAMH 11750]
MASSPSSPRFADLVLNNVVVSIGNASGDYSKHCALVAYEYTGVIPDGHAVCWVPAVPGHQFSIHVGYTGDSLPYPNAGFNVSVYIDGVGPVAESFFAPQDIMRRMKQRADSKPMMLCEITGRELSNGYIRPFCFSLRQTVETDNPIPPENLNYFGRISVHVCWAIDLPPVKQESPRGVDPDDEDFEVLSRPVDETLKQIQHRFAAGLGEPVIKKHPGSQETIETEAVNENEQFFFTFLYRDIGELPQHLTGTPC